MDLLAAIEREAAAYFNAREFGEAAVITLGGGGTVRLQGIFEGDVETLDLGEQVTRDGSAALMHFDTAAVASVSRGDALTARETDYTVTGIEDNGAGVTTLILHRVSL